MNNLYSVEFTKQAIEGLQKPFVEPPSEQNSHVTNDNQWRPTTSTEIGLNRKDTLAPEHLMDQQQKSMEAIPMQKQNRPGSLPH